MKNLIILTITAIALTACGSTKNVTATDNGMATTSTVNNGYVFAGRVSDNASNAQSIVASIDFAVGDGTHDITVDGKLRMKRDEVIRINLTALGLMEVGVLEFTPEYVMIIDRIHTEYVKAAYSDVDFLAKNGISFYSLQALFWNELFVPGEKKVSESLLRNFDVTFNKGADNKIELKKDAMTFAWTASEKDARINSADVTYSSQSHGNTTLHWDYSNFKPLLGKQFPYTQSFNLFSSAIGKGRKANVKITMSSIDTNKSFETRTTPSAKYKKVDAEALLGKLLSM